VGWSSIQTRRAGSSSVGLPNKTGNEEGKASRKRSTFYALARNGAVTLNNNFIGGGCTGGGATVPEPGTMGLLGTGLAILAGAARRRLRI
jgi:hypothetical protein